VSVSLLLSFIHAKCHSWVAAHYCFHIALWIWFECKRQVVLPCCGYRCTSVSFISSASVFKCQQLYLHPHVCVEALQDLPGATRLPSQALAGFETSTTNEYAFHNTLISQLQACCPHIGGAATHFISRQISSRLFSQSSLCCKHLHLWFHHSSAAHPCLSTHYCSSRRQ